MVALSLFVCLLPVKRSTQKKENTFVANHNQQQSPSVVNLLNLNLRVVVVSLYLHIVYKHHGPSTI